MSSGSDSGTVSMNPERSYSSFWPWVADVAYFNFVKSVCKISVSHLSIPPAIGVIAGYVGARAYLTEVRGFAELTHIVLLYVRLPERPPPRVSLTEERLHRHGSHDYLAIEQVRKSNWIIV